MGEDLVGDEQHTDAPGQGGQELVQATTRGRDSQRHRRGAERCGPGQSQLPESDRSFFGLAFDDRRRPQRRERDQEEADDPPDVQDAPDRAV